MESATDGYPDLDDLFAGLYTPVLADILDSLGYRAQFLGPTVRPLTAAQRVAGRVRTVRARRVDRDPPEPYRLEMRMIESASTGDVLLVDADYQRRSAFWGELFTTSARANGIRGIVMTACARDMWALKDESFPVFGIGTSPGDCRGRLEVNAMDEEIRIDGVTANSGDFILGDLDGVVIVPRQVARETFIRAREKVSGENEVRKALAAGMPVSEAFRKFGVL